MLFNLSLSAHIQIRPGKQSPHHMEMGVFKICKEGCPLLQFEKNYVRRTQKSYTQPIQAAVCIDNKNLYLEQLPMFRILSQKKQGNIEEQYPLKIETNKLTEQ